MFVLKKNFDRMQEWAEQNQDAYLQVTKRNIDLMFELADAHQALEDIIAQATAKPNATVARMVAIAREALDKLEAQNAPDNAEGVRE
jgi:hypothetical protein